MPIQPARIRFDDQGNAFSEDYDDIYFNPDDAVGKTRRLFHRANRFDEKLDALSPGQPLVVGELGFGLGLNFLSTWVTFNQHAPAGCRLHYVGLDLAPPSVEQLRQALGRFDGWKNKVDQLLREWPGRVAGVHRLRLNRCELTLHFGEVSACLPGVDVHADAWFLDGFAPEKNPAMWSDQVAQALFTRTRSGGTLGSFTAAGHVRRALDGAGFDVERWPGDPFKRHIVAARKPDGLATTALQVRSPQRVAVVGAGWAGISVADELIRRGLDVAVVDAVGPGHGASGNLQAICAPVLDAAASPRQDFYRSAFILASRQHERCGVFRVPDTQKTATSIQQAADTFGSLDEIFVWRTRDPPQREFAEGLWMPTAGVARFDAWSQALLAGWPASARRWPFVVETMQSRNAGWLLCSTDGDTVEADAVVLACATAVRRFAPTADWPLRSIRGQVSHVRATLESQKSTHAVVGEAYLCPALDGVHSVGATFDVDDLDPHPRPEDHADNQRRARLTDPAWADAMDWNDCTGRVGFRCNTPDYLPMVGPVPDVAQSQAMLDALPHDTVPAPTDWPTVPGLFAVTGLGSHGVITSALAGPLIADMLQHTPPPCDAAARDAVHPGRYLTRAAKRRQPLGYPVVD